MAVKTFSVNGTILPDLSGVSFSNRHIAQAQLQGKANEPVDVTVIFGKVPRSLAQNRYLWGVVYPTIRQHLRELTGDDFTSDEIHAYNMTKIQGIKTEVKVIAGEEYIYLRDKKSSEMSIEEFTTMVDNIIQYSAEKWQLEIPLPQGSNSLDNFINR